MARDRAALKSLFESASNNNVPGCIKAIQPYVNLETSTFEALAQFKDGRERTVLHFAAQSWAKDVVAWIKELVDGEKVNKEEKTRFINGKDEKGGYAVWSEVRDEGSERRVRGFVDCVSTDV